MLKFIDNILNRVTMYRVALYEVIFLLCAAAALGALGLIPYSPIFIAYSAAVIFAFSFAINWLFAKVFNAPSNLESTYITALILALIISPPHAFSDLTYLSLAFWASALAMASKYILAIGKRHLFNPAAFGVAVTALALNQSATWWVGTPMLLPFVLIAGLLLVRKIRRFDLFLSFIVAATMSIGATALLQYGADPVRAVWQSFLYAPIFFFSTVMLTEPLTTPPTRPLRVGYGLLVGALFAPSVHIGSVYSTPELALLCGNLYSYFVSPKQKLILTLMQKIRLTPDTYEFVFATARPLSFRPGQYLEWTLPHRNKDTRGMRRYFTIASAPSEKELRLGVKFYQPASSFKKALWSMREGDTLVASHLSGDFTLPRNPKEKLAFIAGGIGITPFRSMLQHLIDTDEHRSIVMLYSNKTSDDIAYADVLQKAQALGIRTIYALTHTPDLPKDPDVVGKIDAETIRREIPDYLERTFYISGPQGMVDAYTTVLRDLGVRSSRIKRDFFPGFA